MKQPYKHPKAEALQYAYNRRLRLLVKQFFKESSDDAEANEQLFLKLKKVWQQQAHRCNRIQRHTHVRVMAFDETILHTMRAQKLAEIEPEITEQAAISMPQEQVINLLMVTDDERKRMLKLILTKTEA